MKMIVYAIFDLNRSDKEVGRTHKRNRSIQATFWMLKSEHIVSVEILERKGEVVKIVKREQAQKKKSWIDLANSKGMITLALDDEP